MNQAASANPTQRFYDRISGAYDALADSNEHKARQRGLELLNVQPGESVLEIGFGTGHSLVELANVVGETGHVAGVDISPGMESVATNRLEKESLANRVELKIADTPPLPYADDTFNAVNMSFTLELFPLEKIPEMLAEIARVLKPGGRFAVVCMNTVAEGERDSFLEKTYKWMHTHFPHIVDCQPIDSLKFLNDAGYTVIEQDRIEIWTMPVMAVLAQPPASR